MNENLDHHFHFITQIVADIFDVDSNDLIGRSRLAVLCEPRQVAMAFCYGDESKLKRKHLKPWEISTQQVAEFFDNRHHAMVGRAIKRVKDLRGFDSVYRSRIEAIEAKLKQQNKIAEAA